MLKSIIKISNKKQNRNNCIKNRINKINQSKNKKVKKRKQIKIKNHKNHKNKKINNQIILIMSLIKKY
jgi:hypothetical protein